MLWDDVRALPEPWRDGFGADEIRARLIATLDTLAQRGSCCGVKDPRISRLLPLWLPLLERLGTTPVFLIALREPVEVARSLERREGLSMARSLLLWLRYNLEAERHTRGRRRAFVCFDDLLHDWRATLERAARESGIAWPVPFADAADAIGTFLDPELRHHVAAEPPAGAEAVSRGSRATPSPRCARWAARRRSVLRGSTACTRCSRAPTDARSDGRRARGGVAARRRSARAPRIATTARARRRRASSIARGARRCWRTSWWRSATARSWRRRGRARSPPSATLWHGGIAEGEAALAGVPAEVAALQGEVAALQDDVDVWRAEAAALRAEKDAALRVVADVERSLSWRADRRRCARSLASAGRAPAATEPPPATGRV